MEWSEIRKRSFICTAAMCAALLSLTACGTADDSATTDGTVAQQEATGTSEPAASEDADPTPTGELLAKAQDEAATRDATDMPAAADEASASPAVGELDQTSLNSVNMLNYLAVLVSKVHASSNDRLLMEEMYSELIDNTAPDAVDTLTRDELRSILGTIEDFRMTDVKRERLEYLYEQNQAQAVRDAIPNPLGLLSTVQSSNPIAALTSVVYMAVDSATSYSTSISQAEKEYLEEGWALDDEDAERLHESRTDMFTYMIDIVNAYGLPGSLALNESSVDEFVSWENSDNATRRIQFLEANVDTYQGLSAYWLLLAKSYHEAGEYEACLDAVGRYEAYSTNILRKDYDYAKVLTLAVDAAGTTMSDEEYVKTVPRYASAILANCDHDDWALRYFAAQTYVNLYAKSGDEGYLQKAYDTTLDTVNYLVDEQRDLNEAFLAPVQEASAPSDATKDEKKEIEGYNKVLKEARKTELAPVSEPLLLNCDLLFALADVLQIDQGQQRRVDAMLHANGEALFLVDALDERFWFTEPDRADGADATPAVEFSGTELRVPVSMVSDQAAISVSVTSGDQTATFDDWTVKEVERGTEGDEQTFVAVYASEAAKGYDFQVGQTVEVTIDAFPGQTSQTATLSYQTVDTKDRWWKNAMLWDDGVGFVAEA